MLRALQKDDLRTIGYLTHEWQSTLPAYQVKPFDPEYAIKMYETLYDHDMIVGYVVIHCDKIVGLIIGTLTPSMDSSDKEANELHFFIEEKYRSFKEAYRLLELFKQTCIERGAQRITLGSTGDPRLNLLYKRVGFVRQPPSYRWEE